MFVCDGVCALWSADTEKQCTGLLEGCMHVSVEVDALLSGLPFQHSSAQSYLGGCVCRCLFESSWHVQMKSKRIRMMPCLQRRTGQPVAIHTPRQDSPSCLLWNQAKPQSKLAQLPRPRLAGVPDSVGAVPTPLLCTHQELLRSQPLRSQQLQTQSLKPQPFKAV